MQTELMWEEIFQNKEWGKYPPEHLIRFIARNFYNVSNRKEINILELGFGTGANLWFCAREGFRVNGIEFSKSGIERFQKRMQDENLSSFIGQIEQGDYLDKLDDFKDESFDCIFDIASLYCNDRQKSKEILKKVVKKLKKGGKFYSTALSKKIFGYDENKGDFQEPVEGIYTKVGVLRFDDEQSLKELFGIDDFKINSIFTQSIQKDKKIVDENIIIETQKI